MCGWCAGPSWISIYRVKSGDGGQLKQKWRQFPLIASTYGYTSRVLDWGPISLASCSRDATCGHCQNELTHVFMLMYGRQQARAVLEGCEAQKFVLLIINTNHSFFLVRHCLSVGGSRKASVRSPLLGEALALCPQSHGETAY